MENGRRLIVVDRRLPSELKEDHIYIAVAGRGRGKKGKRVLVTSNQYFRVPTNPGEKLVVDGGYLRKSEVYEFERNLKVDLFIDSLSQLNKSFRTGFPRKDISGLI
ncbi:hypothetical protein K9L16_03165 [Candidatus Pacearchaeota archaeon]|nr:hypothetical protein [Candidatus Pacearchaeota archaeon]